MKVEANPGEAIYRAIERAISIAKHNKCPVELVFNTTNIRVYPESYEEDVAEKYWLLRKLTDIRSQW